MKIVYKQNGFVLTETLVAMLITATILLGVFSLVVQSNSMLSQLKKKNIEAIGLESSLAVLRADLNNSLNISGLNQLSKKEDNSSLLLKLDRFIINPETDKPALARISWYFGKNGIMRKISTPYDNLVANMLFSTVSVKPKFSFIGADLWQLKLAFGNKKFVSSIYAISLESRT